MINTTIIEQQQEYKSYKRRWLVLLAFCTFTFTNALPFVQYSPILNLASSFYGVGDDQIVWFSTCYYITYCLFAPLAIKPLEYRLDVFLIFGASIQAIGGWVKYFAYNNYMYALIGYILMGLSQTFSLAAPAYISDRWFPQHQRTMATSIGTFLNQLGLNFSILYSSYTFDGVISADIINTQINQMNWVFAVAMTAALVFCIVFIRNKPPTPPSYTAASDKQSILKSYKRIVKKSESIMDMIAFSMFIGGAWAYGVVIALLLLPYNYTQKQIGYVSLCYSTTGTFGGTIASLYVDNQVKKNSEPNYDVFLKGFITLGLLAIVIKAIIINQATDVTIIILSGVIGLGMNSFLPIAVQAYVEKLFPSFELVLVTALMQSSNFLGFIINYVLVLPQLSAIGLWAICIMLAPFYLYLMIFYKTKCVRFHEEQQQLKQL